MFACPIAQANLPSRPKAKYGAKHIVKPLRICKVLRNFELFPCLGIFETNEESDRLKCFHLKTSIKGNMSIDCLKNVQTSYHVNSTVHVLNKQNAINICISSSLYIHMHICPTIHTYIYLYIKR